MNGWPPKQYLKECIVIITKVLTNFVMFFSQTLQGFMYTMMKDNNPVAAKMSLVGLLCMYTIDLINFVH